MTKKLLTNAEINVELTEVKKDVENLKRDVNELKPLQINLARQEEQYNHILETLASLKEDISELKKRPGRILDYIIMTVIASIIAFIFKMFGV